MRPAAYHRLSRAAKVARMLRTWERLGEPPVTCPHCETDVPPAELLTHVDTRCDGRRRDPHPRSAWIDRARALELAPAPRLRRWVDAGQVRTRDGANGGRAYLLRDVVLRVAERRHARGRTR